MCLHVCRLHRRPDLVSVTAAAAPEPTDPHAADVGPHPGANAGADAGANNVGADAGANIVAIASTALQQFH